MRRALMPLVPLTMLVAVAAAPAPGFTVAGQPFAQGDILDARAIPDMDGGASIMLTFTPAAAQRLLAVTKAQAGKPVPVSLDGTVLIAPTLEQPIEDGVLQLAGRFTLPEAAALAKRISGKDPLPDSLDQ